MWPAPSPLAALYDLLESPKRRPRSASELPPLGHWLYFSVLGPSIARPTRAAIIAIRLCRPSNCPARLCVECRIRFHRPIRVGDAISRLTARRRRRRARGPRRSDRHVAVAPRSSGRSRGRRCPRSEPLYIWRAARPGRRANRRAPRGAPRMVAANSGPTRVLLFRYSALTRNMSRVHYDRPFAVFVDGYPGLVVQGELGRRRLLLDARARPRAANASLAIDLRMHAPGLYDTEPIRICSAAAGRSRRSRSGPRTTEGALGGREARRDDEFARRRRSNALASARTASRASSACESAVNRAEGALQDNQIESASTIGIVCLQTKTGSSGVVDPTCGRAGRAHRTSRAVRGVREQREEAA